ncbi:MAG: hypothetical protein KGI27_05015 [Thaumarchaeota archaeon]|nr:hypothetical protein [Nitrososphaerota archaeon]
MDSFLQYVPLISAVIFAGILSLSIFQFSTVKKSMRIQTEQQVYARILEARLKLESTEYFTNMARDSPAYQERFSAVDKPEEYYIIIAFIDLLEYIFRLYKTRLIDPNLWQRWRYLAEILMTVPKFKKVWEKTRTVHTSEFVEFIESLHVTSSP